MDSEFDEQHDVLEDENDASENTEAIDETFINTLKQEESLDPTNSTAIHLQRISKIKVLTREEEYQIGKQLEDSKKELLKQLIQIPSAFQEIVSIPKKIKTKELDLRSTVGGTPPPNGFDAHLKDLAKTC